MPIALASILAALGGLAFLGTVFVVLVRVVIAPAMAQYILEKDLEHFRKVLRGAISIGEPIVAMTPTDIDDIILERFVKPAMAEFEKVKGKPSPMPTAIAANVVKGMLIEKAAAALAGASLQQLSNKFGPTAKVRP